MVIYIELEDGSIKKYPTSCSIKSMCGMPEYSECNHLDCAICAAEYLAKTNKEFFLICLFGYLFWLSLGILIGAEFPWTGGGVGLIMVLFGIYGIWQSNKSAEIAKELIEFRDSGRINGIKARQIDAKVKHWWQFWK